MKILVCIKQVPGTTKVDIDEKTGTLKRDGVESKMNPYDLYAIEAALRLKQQTGATVAVLTMGPPQASAIIREAFMMGADDGYLLSDRKFAGSDVLATSYALSMGIKAIGDFDLIICGKQTTDGDTAQVGPAIAETLSIPHVTWVSKINEVTQQKIVVEQDLADSTEIAELSYPCLITVEKGLFSPRLPSYKKKKETKGREVKVLSFLDLPDTDEQKYGMNGSPTKVEKIFPPKTNSDRVLLEGSSEELTDDIYKLLLNGKFI